MAGRTQEIEQGFIPNQTTIFDTKSWATQRLEIVQAYLKPDGKKLTLDIHFEGDDAHPSAITIKFSAGGQEILSLRETEEAGHSKLADFKRAIEVEPALLNNVRIRRQKDLSNNRVSYHVLTIKGAKSGGAGSEFEFDLPEQDAHGALKLMIEHGKDHLIFKNRTVRKDVEIGGKKRTLELDEFRGANTGKIKLEIEHTSRNDMIPESVWKEFAIEEVTDREDYRNRTLAKRDPVALQVLRDDLRKLDKPSSLRQDGGSQLGA
jgi:CYTH domain-containing protein